MEVTNRQNNQGFFSFIYSNFGLTNRNNAKLYFTKKLKLASLINKQHFLLRCRKEKVYSRTRKLKNSFNIKPEIFKKLEEKFIFSIINEEIYETIQEMKNINYNLNLLQQVLNNALPPDIFNDFMEHTNASYNVLFDVIKVRQKTKFDNIIFENFNNMTNNLLTTQDKWLVNLTNLDLPIHVKIILSLGHKFCPPVVGKCVPYFQLISDVESAIFGLDEAVHSNIRGKFVNILTNFKHKSSPNLLPHEKRILNYLRQTKQYLRDNPDLLITRADKGNVTVVTYHSDYINKMDNLLNDVSTYVISSDNSFSIQNKVNKMVKNLLDTKKIDEKQKKMLTQYNTTVPRMYGLPKIHKLDTPYRPIVSSIGSPTYLLSAFLSDLLKHSVGNTDSFILNSENFKSKISSVVLPPNFVLVSLDAVSLFTNIDKHLVLDLVSKNWKNIKRNAKTNITKPQFIEMLDFVLSNTEFSFNNKIYKQIFGCPMGSPVSPIVSNLVMEHLESIVLNSLNFSPLFYFRYVDDIITAVPLEKVHYILDAFNVVDNRIKFTLEMESDNKLPFLDLLLVHEPNGTLSFDWFHKDTWSGRYLDFNSCLPLSYKINTIKILCQKIIKLSDSKYHFRNFRLLKNTLLDNHYPEKIIDKITRFEIFNPNSRNHHLTNTHPSNNTDSNKFLSIPYVKGLFEKIKSIFKNQNFKVVGRPVSNLGKSLFSNLKDRVPFNKQSNLVYKIKCSCNASYVGQTKQYLQRRIYQHKHDATKSTMVNGNNKNVSALSRHLSTNGHTFELDDVQILEKEQKFRKRMLLEMLHIKSNNNSLNIQEDSQYIGNYYNSFL